MPRFNPFETLSNARATTRVFNRGIYDLKINKAQPFYYEKDNGDEVYGVRFYFKMVGPVDDEGNTTDQYAGEDVAPLRMYLHSEGAMSINKRFLMAAAGYSRNDEEAFDEEWLQTFADELWVEPTGENTVEMGKAYEDLEGNIVRCRLDVELYEGEEQQNHAQFYVAE